MKYFIIILAICLTSEFAFSNDMQQFEKAFYQEVNLHRINLGLNPVSLDNQVNLIMKQHVANASGYELSQFDNNPKLRKTVAHQNIESRTTNFKELVKKQGNRYLVGGEISYLGFYPIYDKRHNLSITESAKELLKQFLASPGHRAIIEGSYNEGSLFGLASTLKDDRIIISAYFIGIA